ncbi:GntR family transcriptional regulator [Rhodoplanes sp. TEM]|uniref:GntR family transcriptional regulator n=1 Tax=Rhodoplanes tepidamans TaxID=200616 RepID=A0ABT5JIA0_RHOTP|nr:MULTISPECIES: GntR family transcriptional regulator [Rhodoplanes]MDC7788750.1 GntR family transcriptional regulator [Rhodoplanes tepidamans]MDC7983435.1 GntR family transcriptional regulator [Rhodoplanes sp. TEM]MDQ0354571.1 GntR family transcriptional regulator [Rhodoplanes tepidamans]
MRTARSAAPAGRPKRSAANGDADSRVPRYLQVAAVLRRRLRDGIWSVGERIATLEELEREFGVARVTVRQAIELLQSEGLLESQQGRGTFVTNTVDHRRWLQLATDWESLISMIRENVPHPLPAGVVGTPRIAPGEGRRAAAYRFLRSLQTRDGEPFGYARVHLARDVYRLAPKQFAARAALVVLAEMKGIEIARAHQTFTFGSADVETATLLGIGLAAPTVEARCVVADAAGTVIYVGEITYRGDCVSLDIELRGAAGGKASPAAAASPAKPSRAERPPARSAAAAKRAPPRRRG